MKIFGLEITRARRPRMAVDGTVVSGGGGGWFSVVQEWFPGAWQNSVVADKQTLLSFSAVFACVTTIASDIAKLRVRIVEEDDSGVCTEVELDDAKVASQVAVLRKPNSFQNRIKFIEQWIVSKLLNGNTYALKLRNTRKQIIGLFILDPQRVQVLVTPAGDVYYQISKDSLSKVRENITVPASEIIHDMMVSLWHPLCGVSPIYACAVSAMLGNKIQNNSTKFFDNMSRPSGMLSAPGSISTEVAERLKKQWEENFSGQNIGRLAVLGDGLEYEAMTIPAREAQLIDQLKWTVEDVARCFHVPMYKLGGSVPQGSSIEQLNQGYYSECLQVLIESLEVCFDEGLQIEPPMYTDMDLSGLLRMDATAQMKLLTDGIKGIMMPDEARAKLNLKPVTGGDAVYMQQQNYSLAALAKRDARPDPFATPQQPQRLPPPAPKNEDEEALMREVIDGLNKEAVNATVS